MRMLASAGNSCSSLRVHSAGGLVGHDEQILRQLVLLAAPAQLIDAIEDEPPHTLSDVALGRRELLEALPLAALQPARDQRAQDVARAVRAPVVHRALDLPDD